MHALSLDVIVMINSSALWYKIIKYVYIYTLGFPFCQYFDHIYAESSTSPTNDFYKQSLKRVETENGASFLGIM